MTIDHEIGTILDQAQRAESNGDLTMARKLRDSAYRIEAGFDRRQKCEELAQHLGSIMSQLKDLMMLEPAGQKTAFYSDLENARTRLSMAQMYISKWGL